MPDGTLHTTDYDPSTDPNLFVKPAIAPTDPDVATSMQASFTQPANGYAMEAISPGITEALENADVNVTVTIDPEFLAKVDMATTLEQIEPAVNQGSEAFGGFFSAIGSLAEDVGQTAGLIRPDTEVVAQLDPQQLINKMSPTSSIG